MLYSYVICAIVLVLASADALNSRPIIGVMTEPWDRKEFSEHGGEYIAASYVKYLEMAGARVVPISFKMNRTTLDTVFNGINGILFPGGGVDLTFGTPWLDSANYLYQKLKAANDKGDYFPLWGTCMGFETILILESLDDQILDPTDAYNISMPLEFIKEVLPKSKLFGNAPASIMNMPVTMNNHHWGISPQNFTATSTNVDKQGVRFISTFECTSSSPPPSSWLAYKYPIYASQWHPEKNLFEWSLNESFDHSPEGLMAMQYMAGFFVDQARRNNHKFSDFETEKKYLIYNYNPVYTQELNYFTQTYVSNFIPGKQ